MHFSDELIDKTLYSGIYGSAHRRERSMSFVKVLAKNFRYLFKSRLKSKSDVHPSILFFSSKFYFDLNAIPYPVYWYKERLDKKLELDFRHEEHWLFAAFLLPRFMQRRIFSHVYKSIEKGLAQINIKVFICNNPELISHMVAHYLKNRGGVTITMQHGTYSLKYKPLYFETDVADLCFVWGNDYKACYIRGGVAPDAVRIVSAPFTYTPSFNVKFKEGAFYKPIFLGQQLYKIHPEVVPNYNKALEELISVYAQRNIKFVYKPHPREDVNKSLYPQVRANLSIIGKKNVGDDYFDEYSHAYSINSTALIKALCAGLQCFQVNLEATKMNNEIFAERTSVKWLGIPEIKNHLAAERFDSNYVSADYINFQADPRAVNAGILTQIMHERAKS